MAQAAHVEVWSPPADRLPGDPLRLLRALPVTHQHAALRITAERLGWKDTRPLPLVDDIETALMPPPDQRETVCRTDPQYLWRIYRDNHRAWRLPEPGPDLRDTGAFVQALDEAHALDEGLGRAVAADLLAQWLADEPRAPEPVFDVALATQLERARAAEAFRRLRAWREHHEFAEALARFLDEITPPPAVVNPLGIDLMAADEAELAEWARQLADTPLGDQPRDASEWRSYLRGQIKRARSYFRGPLKLVGRGSADYVDEHGLACWRARQERARKFGERTYLVREDDPTRRIRMADRMASSLTASRARLYSICKGAEELGARAGWTPVFLTLTLPPIWHPNPTKGERHPDHDPKEHHARAACAELQTMWARLRARMQKQRIRWFGVWTREPHKDGCPHQHAMLWLPPENVDALRAAVRYAWPTDAAADIRVLDDEPPPGVRRASPTSYLMKYLIKALNWTPPKADQAEGDAPFDADGDGDHIANHDRVRAWASETGVRRYGFTGMHGIQRVWQAIHQWGENPPPDASPAMMDVWQALRTKDWASALERLGAIKPQTVAASDNRRIRVAYEEIETPRGRTYRRARWLVDATAGVEVDIKPYTWLIETVENHGEETGLQIPSVTQGEGPDEPSRPAGSASGPPAGT